MRILLKIAKVFLIIIICLELIAGTYMGTKKLQQERQTQQAAIQIVDAKSAAAAKLGAQIANQLSLLHVAGVVGDTLGVSKRDVCYIHSQASGWTTSSYYQKCYVRYVQGFTAVADKQATLAAITKTPYVTELFGTPVNKAENPEVYPCSLFARDNNISLTYLPANLALDETTTYDCEIPEQLQGMWSVAGGIMLDEDLSVKTYTSFDQKAIDHTTAQLWLEYDIQYYDEALGCAPTSFIFCDSPRLRPVQAPLDL